MSESNEEVVKNIDAEDSIDLDELETFYNADYIDFESENSSWPAGSLTYFQGLGLVIGLQVGSGIFASPNQVHIHAGSYGASLLIWCLSGLLAWSGASCYAELGCAIPLNGGTQAYLARIYNDHISFLFSWTALVALKPGSAAIIAIVLAEYLSTNPIAVRGIAILTVFSTAGLNLVGHGVAAGAVYLIYKCLLLVGIAALSAVVSLRAGDDQAALQSFFEGTNGIGDLIIALYGGIWAYDGWDNLNFLTAEMRNPKRDLPRVICTAMPSVIAGYCLVNFTYFIALNGQELDNSNSVVLTVANKFGSRALSMLVSAGVAFSCAGALNASMVSMGKLGQAVSESKMIPHCFTQHRWAIVLEAVITSIYCCIGEFKQLVTFYGVSCYIFYLLTVVGLVILRFREPDLHRPYRTWLIAPFVFILLSVALIARTAFANPWYLLIALLFNLVGSSWYYLMKNRFRS